MKYTAALVLLFLFADGWSQEVRKPLRGKVAAGASNVAELIVINRATNNAVAVQARGYFTIDATVGDTLQFSSPRFKARQRVVRSEDFNQDLMLIELESIIELDEVIVQRNDKINAVSLGILQNEPKRYTPAERHLAAADGSQNRYGLDTKISGDAIINAISGRTAMLKKEIKVEKKESLMKQIDELFDESFFTGNLQIPTIYVRGFLYYIVENDSFTRLLPGKNKIALSFLMTQLAQVYKQTISVEKD